MLFQDSKKIYTEVENKLLLASNGSLEIRKNLFAPLRVIFFGIGSFNFNIITFRFAGYLLLSLILYSIILSIFVGTISNEILVFFLYPLTLLFPSLFSLLAPPSDSAFLRISEYEVNDAIEIIKNKRTKQNKELSEDYLNGLKENFQLIEKDATQRNLLVKSLLAGIYFIGIYLVGVASKMPISSLFTLLSIITFLLFYLLVECHSGLKDKIFSVLYCAITEIKSDIKDEETMRDNKLLENTIFSFSSNNSFNNSNEFIETEKLNNKISNSKTS